MQRRGFLRAMGGATTVGSTAIAGCGADKATSTRAENTVGMLTSGQVYFDPIGLAIESGETVTFQNESGRHSTTAYRDEIAAVRRIPEDAQGWNSGTFNTQGETFEHTFEVEGTYDYFCIPHKSVGMVGRIVVGDPGGPAEGTMPPDGMVPESTAIVEAGSVPFSEFEG